MFYSVFNRRFNLDQEAAIIFMSETRLTCAERERDKAREAVEKRLSQKKNKFCLTRNKIVTSFSRQSGCPYINTWKVGAEGRRFSRMCKSAHARAGSLCCDSLGSRQTAVLKLEFPNFE